MIDTCPNKLQPKIEKTQFNFQEMKSEIIWLNNNVSPYALSVLFMCAADLNWVTAYLFVASFLSWITMVILYASVLIYDRGILRWMFTWVEAYIRHVWGRLSELKNLYWMKVFCGILIGYLVISCGLWIMHFDFLNFIRSTLDFIRQLPALLVDTHQLILAIQRWLNLVLLGKVVHYISTAWTWQKNLIYASPWLGALSISVNLFLVTVLLELGCWLRGFSLVSVAQAIRSALNE